MGARAFGQRGLAAVELALMTPVFLFMLVATEEIGRALYEYNSLNKSVRDAAQYLARNCVLAGQLDLADCGLTDKAKLLVVYGNPAGGGTPLVHGLTVASVDVTTPGAAPFEYVQVTANYTFQPLFPIRFIDSSDEVDGPQPLVASVKMRAL